MVAAGVLVAPVGKESTARGADACEVQIRAGDDLDAIVNRDPGDRATTFCVGASASGTTYRVSTTVQLRAGDKLLGVAGSTVARGPASYGVPKVNLRADTSLRKVIQLSGGNIRVAWLDIAGGEVGIGAGDGTASTRLEYLTIHDTRRAGVNAMRGHILHSNLYNNGMSSAFWGYSAAAVKGVDEYEAAYNFVHDNPANGLWCDHRCSDAGAAMPNGFWAHGNLLVENGRWGVRYEYSPIVASGVHGSHPTALIEGNSIHGNGYKDGGSFGGASMYDAQNGTFRNNTFGARTVAGVSYPANAKRRAILFGDSGKATRTDLWNGDAIGNTLGAEAIAGCALADAIVYCSGNR